VADVQEPSKFQRASLPDKSMPKSYKNMTPDTYEGKTFEELQQESIDLYDKDYLNWNSNVMPSPDNNKVAYLSNKHDLKSLTSALFVYDPASGVETKLTHGTDAAYMIIGWLNSSSLIGQKVLDSSTTWVVIGLDGKETELELEGESPYIYAVQDGLIAYATALSSGEIHILRINDAGSFEEIYSVNLPGTTRLREGQGFSNDNSYFAFLYVPDAEPEERYMKVIDLHSNNVIDIDSFPEEVYESAVYLEFTWTDNHTLLLTIHEDVSGSERLSAWSYSLD